MSTTQGNSVQAFPEKLTHDFGIAITIINYLTEQKHLQKYLVASDLHNCINDALC